MEPPGARWWLVSAYPLFSSGERKSDSPQEFYLSRHRSEQRGEVEEKRARSDLIPGQRGVNDKGVDLSPVWRQR